jgi:hypothetical protein
VEQMEMHIDEKANNAIIDDIKWDAIIAVIRHILINFLLVSLLLGTQFLLRKNQFLKTGDLVLSILINSLDFIGVTIFILTNFLLNDAPRIKDRKTKDTTTLASILLLITSLLYYPFFATSVSVKVDKEKITKTVFNYVIGENNTLICQTIENFSYLDLNFIGFIAQMVIFFPSLFITSYVIYTVTMKRW